MNYYYLELVGFANPTLIHDQRMLFEALNFSFHCNSKKEMQNYVNNKIINNFYVTEKIQQCRSENLPQIQNSYLKSLNSPPFVGPNLFYES